MSEQSRGRILTFSMGGAVLAGLYLTRCCNYLLFHVLIEFFSVLVACGIFVIAWNTRRITVNTYVLFFGISSLFIGGVDLLHALAYKGMGVFPAHGANLPTQLWIVARYLQGFALVLAPLFMNRRLRPGLTLAAFLVVTSLLLAAVFTGHFPDCYLEGAGLTPFKKVSEYLICLLLVCALVLMRRDESWFDRDVARLLSLGVVLFIASELFFTLYTDVFGIFNMVGHLLKFAGFILVYRAIIVTTLTRPYQLLFRELTQRQKDVESLNAELTSHAGELETANCELQATLHRLEAANRELASANKELESFSYTVSHDLRTPLTCVDGYCQLLLERRAGRTDAQRVEFIGEIRKAVGRMQQFITTILNFSQLTRTELRREAVDLTRLALLVSLELRSREPERAVTFDIEENVKANGDAKLLRVVMDNLIGNAWKYTGRRPGAMIEFGTRHRGEETVYYVRDNGAGFDMSGAERLFTAFERLHSREDFEGIGIGLATVQRIIQSHGGRVWAEGEPDRGATFYFTLAGC